MAFLSRSYILGVSKLCRSSAVGPVCIQVRWKKVPKRKPRWLPMAKSKVFRIPEHPHVSPDEKELVDDLIDEYYRKIESMRILFAAELAQKFQDEGHTLEYQKQEEDKFRLVLEQNKMENDRVKAIREETMEKLFQDRLLKLLQHAEKKKEKELKVKMKVEEIVRKEMEKSSSFITYETLENAVEKAIDRPENVNFSIDINANITWEGKPPVELEEDLKRRVSQSMKN